MEYELKSLMVMRRDAVKSRNATFCGLW